MIYITLIELLRQQLKDAHELQESTFADVTNEVADKKETNKALPVGAAYAHSVLGEDVIVSTMLAHKAPLVTDAASVGLSALMPDMAHWDQHEEWGKTVTMDVATFKAYAQKVYAATDAWLATLTDADLEKPVAMEGSTDTKPLIYYINNYIILHCASLAGEISAAKGFQGLKGYPW